MQRRNTTSDSFRYLLAIIAGLMLFGCRTAPASTIDRELEAKIREIIAPKRARIGVGVVWNHRPIAAVNDDSRYPLMSVMKFHQALAVADTLSRRGISPDTTLRIARNDLKADTWSPLRDRYPLGDIDLSVRELLVYTLRLSDNNACDILFDRFGGPVMVDRYIRSLGFERFAIRVTEEQMHSRLTDCYENRGAPSETAMLLDRFIYESLFIPDYKEFIMQAMISCTTGADRLPAGVADTGAVVGHKTGTGDRNEAGLQIGCNDAGFVRLPDGDYYTIAVFIRDSAENDAENARTIAAVSDAVYRHIRSLKKR